MYTPHNVVHDQLHFAHYEIIHYVTLLAYQPYLTLNQSQGGHFWRGRPARPHLCVQNKYTLVHILLRGLSNSDNGKRGEGKQRVEERRREKEGSENNVESVGTKCLQTPPGLVGIHW